MIAFSRPFDKKTWLYIIRNIEEEILLLHNTIYVVRECDANCVYLWKCVFQ